MANPTLYDILTRNNTDAYTGLVEDYTKYAPEASAIPVIVRSGTRFTTLSRIALPQAQFRSVNQQITGSSSTYKKTEHEMFFLDTHIIVDEAAYAADQGITGDVLLQESQGALQSTINTIGSQFYYGTGNPGPLGTGFVGIRGQLLSNLQNNPAATPVTASRDTNSTSIYGCWLNPQGVSFALGRHGEIAVRPFVRQYVGGLQSGGDFAWVSNISCYIGLTVASANSIYAVTGVDAANPGTDNLIGQMLATVPLTRRAGFTLFMNRNAQFYLEQSRSSIKNQPAGPGGTPAVSPTPTSAYGYPIVVTDSITNTEDNT
jgi:hypothetical protein